MMTKGGMFTRTSLTFLSNPSSLELLVLEGVRKSIKGEKVNCDKNKEYFGYQLLTPWRLSFGYSLIDGYEIPRLPSQVRIPVLNGLIHPILKNQVMEKKDYLDKQLERVLSVSEIVQKSSGASTFGFEPKEMYTALLVPASTVEEADHKIKRYAHEVSNILGSNHLRCPYVICPVIEKS